MKILVNKRLILVTWSRLVSSIGRMFLVTLRIVFFITMVLLTGWSFSLSAAEVKTHKTADGWQLLVGGKPYMIKGVCFGVVKIGESPHDNTWHDWSIVDDDHDGRNDTAYQSWVDTNGNNKRDADELEAGDFKLMRQMGVNTIRVYHHASADPEIKALYKSNINQSIMYGHAPNKKLFRDLFKTYGIRIAMGDFLGAYTAASGASWKAGTDYRDPEQRRRMLLCVEAMVKEFKDEPYILMWIIGNENRNPVTHTNANLYKKEWAQFVNEAAQRIHKMDPRHPVALCDWDPQQISEYAKYLPDIDIYGVNSYRYPGFGTLWKEIASAYDRPVMLTEYGISKPCFIGDDLDEDHHALVYTKSWEDISAHAFGGTKMPLNSIGGFAYEWLDQWWPDSDPWKQDHLVAWNMEVCGIASQGDGSHSPLMRHLRKTYYSLQKLWIKE